nr:protein lethal(2)essential for life-like [Aedes albopictus]
MCSLHATTKEKGFRSIYPIGGAAAGDVNSNVRRSDEEKSSPNVVVEHMRRGKHDNKQDDHEYIFRHIIQRYIIPPGQDYNHIKSSFLSDGILTTPKKAVADAEGHKSIPIDQTGQPLKITGADHVKKQSIANKP